MKKDWKMVKIPEALFYQEGPGVRKHQFTNEGVKLLNVGNINNGQINLSKTKIFISEKEAFGKYKHFLVDDGDLVIASSGIVVDNFYNKIAFIKKEHLPLCMNTSTIRFKVLNINIIDINYFKYFLKTKFFSDQLKKLITGSAQLNFGPSHLKKIDLLLPPLTDQKRIIKILDKADALRQKRKQAIGLLDEYSKSVFFEMFGDPVKNERGWEIKTIEQLVNKDRYAIKRGPFGGSLKKEVFVKSGYLVYEQYHALNNDFTMARYFIDEKKFNELKAFEVKPGDIIVSCSGVYLGKLAIVPKGSKKGIINQALLKISLDNTKINNLLFIHIFTNPNFKNKFFGNNIGSGIPNFPAMTEFKKFKFICPPIELQNKFESIYIKTELLKQKMFDQAEEMEKQFQALMQMNFSQS